MGTGEIIALILLALIIGLALLYIIRAKRRGKKCIGCPYNDCCNKSHSCKSSKEK